jgi:hypothetical protein
MLIAKKYQHYIASAYQCVSGGFAITLKNGHQFAGGGHYREFTSAAQVKRALRGIYSSISPYSLSDY